MLEGGDQDGEGDVHTTLSVRTHSEYFRYVCVPVHVCDTCSLPAGG